MTKCTVCDQEVTDERDVWYLDTCSYEHSREAKRRQRRAVWDAEQAAAELLEPQPQGLAALLELGVRIR